VKFQPPSDELALIRAEQAGGSRVVHAVPLFDDRRKVPMRDKRIGNLMVVFFLLLSSTCFAQNKSIGSDARQQIDAGNQAWIDGMKQGRVALIAATYTPDAVDCSPAGDCTRGRTAIEEHMQEEMSKLGKANSASVTSMGSIQQGRFVYEWGQAEAHFPHGRKIVDRYLTAWQEQPDGTWKIFRNLVIPNR
jgi:ketosteroid isomerase-like protein